MRSITRYQHEWVINAVARDPYARFCESYPDGIACEWVFDNETAAREALARKQQHPLARSFRYELYRRSYVAERVAA